MGDWAKKMMMMIIVALRFAMVCYDMVQLCYIKENILLCYSVLHFYDLECTLGLLSTIYESQTSSTIVVHVSWCNVSWFAFGYTVPGQNKGSNDGPGTRLPEKQDGMTYRHDNIAFSVRNRD